MQKYTSTRGFLPSSDPAQRFEKYPELSWLDELGRDLPSLLLFDSFRDKARKLKIPKWPEDTATAESLAELRLYYVRVGFLASAYINQVGQPAAHVLPENIGVPLCHSCKLLQRPPILSYDGYALYNWKRFDADAPIALGNIDTLQNFVHLYDEHWFILVHVEIEGIAADVLDAVPRMRAALPQGDADSLNRDLAAISASAWRQVEVLRRIAEKMDPALYYKTFRPYIRFFENVVYEGVSEEPMDYRGETGAQSSIMPMLVELMKIKHEPSALIDHLADMQRFMPKEHRQVIDDARQLPSFREIANKQTYNDILEAMATFREVHYGWADEYINRRVEDPRGTGGTPYMQWLKQLVDETRAHMID